MFHFTIVLLLVCCTVTGAKAWVQTNLNHGVKKNHHEKEDSKNSETSFEQNDKNFRKIHKIEIRDQNEKISMDSNDRLFDGLLSQIFSKQPLLENHLDGFRDLENLLRRNIRQDIEYWEEKQPELKVGFGGKPQGDPKRILFANATNYVNKAINQAQKRLKQCGSKIYANNPPYVIYKIPRTPISFILKSIEGASTITPQGTSMSLHYFDSLFTYTQFKFQEIRYNYEIQVKLMNLFTIRKSLTVVLENARVWMPVAVENNSLTIQRFEFIQPDVTVEGVNNISINYLLNDIIIDQYYPEIKQKLADIASRDTKLLLDAHVEDAQ